MVLGGEWATHPMDVLTFAATVILVTASGALTPGPLFFATLSNGMKSGARIGLLFSATHSLIELALIVLLAFGLMPYSGNPLVRSVIGVVGGVVLIILGVTQIIKPPAHESKNESHRERNLLVIGLALTGLNPIFIFWWLTVGINLVFMALEVGGLAGIFLLFASHSWMDIAFLTTVAYLSQKGTNFLGVKGYRAIVALSGAIMIYFGFDFLSIPFTQHG